MELLLPLVCLCLLSCSGDAVRVVVEEGSDAVLPCSPSTKEDLRGNVFDWQKDRQKKKKEVFLYAAGNHYNNGRMGQDQQFIGRVSHFQDQLKDGNASIKITRTKMEDSGTYSCFFPNLQPSQTFNIELVVEQVLRDRTGEKPGVAPEPCIRTLAQTKDSSLMQCEAHGDPLPTLKWKDSDNNTLPAEETKVLERGSRSYITVKITVTKTDDYCCVATQETLSHQVAAVTSVYVQGASKPSVKTIKTDEGTVLQCEVLGVSPKPKMEWKDSSGNILTVDVRKETESGGRYDIIIQTAVTKTDTFHCVVTQGGISHQTEAEIYASVNGSNTGWIVGVLVLSLLLVVAFILLVLRAMGGITLNPKKDKKSDEVELNPTVQNPTTTEPLNPPDPSKS